MTDSTGHSADVVTLTAEVIAFGRGRQGYKNGAQQPENAWTDAEWRGRLNQGQAYWLGWMTERALTLLPKGEVS